MKESENERERKWKRDKMKREKIKERENKGEKMIEKDMKEKFWRL